jgi:hypothetical protein
MIVAFWKYVNVSIGNYFKYHVSVLIRFKHILQPIADVCISKEQKGLVDFESFFTHTICHECCHGIGPHTITLPDGQKSTVRKVIYITFLFILHL